MKVLVKIPEKEYPYLAVWRGQGELLNPETLHFIEKKDIVLISLVHVKEDDKQCDKRPYVQYVLGGRPGFITDCENEYCALPKGFSLELCQ